MTVADYIALFCVLALVAVILQQMRFRRKLRTLAAQITTLRRLEGQEVRYRPIGPNEPWLVDVKTTVDEATNLFQEMGLTVLGDLIEEDEAENASGVTRWFVDRERTTCGWVAAVPSQQGIQLVAFLFSETGSHRFVVTHMGPTSIRLATPPFVSHAHYPSHGGLAAVLTAHQEALSSSCNPTVLRNTVDLPAAVTLVGRLRKATADWRASQPPDELLIQDLRSVLQGRFDELGSSVLRLLTRESSTTTSYAA